MDTKKLTKKSIIMKERKKPRNITVQMVAEMLAMRDKGKEPSLIAQVFLIDEETVRKYTDKKGRS